mmetsp:Transcript_848/g.2615  ORF Transcript_848/g.2615 Transcript_848/m.2615 type:complete len:202 (+) Transcript_848:1524-2129(+)
MAASCSSSVPARPSACPTKMMCRVSSSAKITPIDHMSTAALYSLAPNSSSGGRYHMVTASWYLGRTGDANSRARPKSATLSCLSTPTSRLPGLRSRCAIHVACRCCRPVSACRSSALMSAILSVSELSRMMSSSDVGQYSRTRWTWPLNANTSWSARMLPCESSCITCSSRMADMLTPSLFFARKIFLTATMAPVVVSTCS